MSFKNYSDKLFKEGHLKLNDVSIKNRIATKLWNVDFGESVIWIEAKVSDFPSVLGFFWASVFYLREAKLQFQADEIIAQTSLEKLDYSEALSLVQKCSKIWFEESGSSLIPNADKIKWTNKIWSDENDVFITFEDDNKFYAFNWELMGHFEPLGRLTLTHD